MKKIFPRLRIFFIAFLFVPVAFSQSDLPERSYDVRPNAIEDYRQRNSDAFRSSSSQSNNIPDSLNSDMGIQRPVEAKDKGFGYHLGFETKIYHSNNPASVDGGPYKTSAGIWENALRNNFLLGAYDLGGASFSPILSLSYTKFTHFGDDFFDTFDFDSLGLSFAGIFQFSNGWSLRPSMSFNADLNPREGLERQYSQFSPSLALGKSFSMDPVFAFLEWSLGYNFTDTAYSPGTADDLMNRFETAAVGGLIVPFGNFEFGPMLRFALIDYSKVDRIDFMSSLSLQLQYAFAEWFKVKLQANLSARNSDQDNMDFTKLDTGIGASLDARF
tara:strand:+ start:2712 stop:3701 length:990 start_codon:yes stop_codon:yes gene_type:complete